MTDRLLTIDEVMEDYERRTPSEVAMLAARKRDLEADRREIDRELGDVNSRLAALAVDDDDDDIGDAVGDGPGRTLDQMLSSEQCPEYGE